MGLVELGMTKTTFIATAPDGTQIKRTTATRSYTHAVLVYGRDHATGARSWGQISFNSREDLAVKEASKWTDHFDQIVVVPVAKA